MSTNNIQHRAKAVGGHGLAVTEITNFNGYGKHPIGNFMVPMDYSTHNKHRISVLQAPTTTVQSSTFFNGVGKTDFELDDSAISTLTNAYIKVSVTNGTGASCTLAPTPFWVDKLEILNSTGTELAAITGQELFLSLAFLSRNEFDQLASYLCMSNAYATTGTALADGASGVYYIPVFHMLNACKLHLAGIKGDLTIRLKTSGASLSLLAGSHPTVTDVSLVMKGYAEPDNRRQSRIAAYNAKVPLKLPFYNWQRVQSTQTLAANSKYNVVLQGFSGPVMGMFVCVRSAPSTGAGQGTYQAIKDIDVQLAGGESLIGHYVKGHADLKIENAELFNNTFGANKDWYFVSFSSDPSGDYGTGSTNGYQVFDGKEKLIFGTGP
eukprot:TRINITY_DN692_c0_g1_i17.p2 TRINITY_DN692_c0_g1~~TRINITY_DN692_c0_g1_i17.p2  ORF type:complete len:380 (+),score=32.86 TRINITY_DN692_c0_g1_i17:2007-3146(+)